LAASADLLSLFPLPENAAGASRAAGNALAMPPLIPSGEAGSFSEGLTSPASALPAANLAPATIAGGAVAPWHALPVPATVPARAHSALGSAITLSPQEKAPLRESHGRPPLSLEANQGQAAGLFLSRMGPRQPLDTAVSPPGPNGNDSGNAIAVSSFNGQVYVTGSCFDANTGHTNAFVAEFNPGGGQVRIVTVPDTLGGVADSGNGITIDPNTGNIYVTGYLGANSQVFVAEFDPLFVAFLGETVLPSFAGGPDSGNGIAFDTAHNVVDVTGSVTDAWGSEAFIAQFNAINLALNWGPVLINPNTGGTSGKAIDVDAAGNSFVTGYTNVNGPQQIFVAKVTPTGLGSVSLLNVYGGPDSGNGIKIAGGNFVLIGTVEDNNFVNTTDLFLAEFTWGNPNPVFADIFTTGTGDPLTGNALAIDSMGNIAITGTIANVTVSGPQPLFASLTPFGNLIFSAYGVNSGNGNGLAVNNLDAYSTGAWLNGLNFTDAFVANWKTNVWNFGWLNFVSG
jgi:hypothetical protein